MKNVRVVTSQSTRKECEAWGPLAISGHCKMPRENVSLPLSLRDPDLIPVSVRSPGEASGNPLQYSSWRIPWIEEPGGLQSMGSQRVVYDGVTNTFTFMHRSVIC